MFSYIVIFVCIWWIVFFIALPFKVKQNLKPKSGHDQGAPVNSHLKLKIIITTLATLVLTKIVIYVIENGYLAKLAENYLAFLSSLL